jgi:very-short-patch-repair endonuclease
MTDHEVKLWNWLREDFGPLGYQFRRQVPIERFVVDFACLKARLVVEVDGGGHGFDGRARLDRHRDKRLAELGFRVLRVWNNEIDRQKNVVLDAIYAALTDSSEER